MLWFLTPEPWQTTLSSILPTLHRLLPQPLLILLPSPEALIFSRLDWTLKAGEIRDVATRNAIKRTRWHEWAWHEQTTEGQGDTREDILFDNNDEWIKGKRGRGGSPQAIAAEPKTCCVPPAPSLFWKQAAVHGFSPPLFRLTVSSAPSCVVNTLQRGGLLLTKQTK